MENMKQEFISAFDQHSDALFRQCFFKVHDRELAKDILQDTFLKAWKYVSEGKEVSNMKAFLYKILNNLIIDEYRKKKPQSLDVLEESGFEPHANESSTIEDKIDGARALSLINKLPEPYKEPVFLKFVNGLEISEIADITGEAENTVSVHIHRGLSKLKQLFEYEK